MLIEVFVAVESRQVDAEGGSSDISLTAVGKYYEKADVKYITYKETELTGLEGTTTLIKLDANCVSVIRMGSVEAKQVFSAGQRHVSPYITPYGTFEIAVMPWIVEVVMQEGTGRVQLEYDVEIDGHPISRNSMKIEVKKT